MEKNKKNIFLKIRRVIGNIVYYGVLIPLLIITLIIVYQEITMPDKIPDVFGWKMFIVLDEYMDETIEYGDLVFTKNINTDELNKEDLVAFRNNLDTVTIHRIIDIAEKTKINEQTKEQTNSRTFTMKTIEGETNDTKYVKDSKIEGIVKNKIPRIGLIIIYIQQPLVLFIVVVIILIIGLICLLIAKKLDKRDEEKKAKEIDETKDTKETIKL